MPPIVFDFNDIASRMKGDNKPQPKPRVWEQPKSKVGKLVLRKKPIVDDDEDEEDDEDVGRLAP